jgi:hypothetical protein
MATKPEARDTSIASAALTRIGLSPADAYAIGCGRELGALLSPVIRYYFADEYVAVPPADVFGELGRGVDAFSDVRQYLESPATTQSPSAASCVSPLVWLAAPATVAHTHLSADGSKIECDGVSRRFALTERLPQNRAWFDQASSAYLAQRPLRIRGTLQGDALVARVVWPEDFRVDAAAPLEPLIYDDRAQLALRRLMRSEPRGGAQSPFAMRVLWERERAARSFAGKPVLFAIVNGAQGDDDEAWGGHFAIGTGVLPADGSIAELLVNNFYSLDVISEKGILAAPVPLDGYLGDLNSGQAWYRPSFIMIAVLRDARAAIHTQRAFDRVFRQFWRHQLVYRHSTMNCASICVDTLRAAGWRIPGRGPSNPPLAWLSVPWMLAKERSVTQARTVFEYLTEDATRLFPAAAFEETGADLLRLAQRGASPADGPLARLLGDDLDALLLLRIPQLPSSRRFGTYPVVTPTEYTTAWPHDPADAQIIPLEPRPFPDELRDPDLLPEPPRRSDLPLHVWAMAAFGVLAWIAWQIGKRVF